jgi:hypothetical protein
MRSLRLLLLPVLLLSALSACQTWYVRGIPQDPAPRALPSPVRVTLTDGSVLVMRDAEVRADSLIGMVGERAASPLRVAVAMPQVRRVEERGVDFPATVGLTTAITLTVVATVVITVFFTLGGLGD